MIYEPSPHPAPPVSLVFLIFSSSSHVPKASPRNPAQRGFGNIGRLEHWPGGGGRGLRERKRVQRVWVKPLVCFLPLNLPYLLPEQPG